MDIHKPKPVHTLREFLGELGTIILGILIALGLEAALQEWHSARLVDYTREDFRTEIAADRAQLAGDLTHAAETQANLTKLLAAGADLLAGKALPPDILRASFDRSFAPLASNAWSTALSVQVMSRFPHREARAIASLYAAIGEFDRIQAEDVRNWIDVASYLVDREHLSTDQIREGLRRASAALVFVQSLAATEKRLIEACDKTLAVLGGPAAAG